MRFLNKELRNRSKSRIFTDANPDSGCFLYNFPKCFKDQILALKSKYIPTGSKIYLFMPIINFSFTKLTYLSSFLSQFHHSFDLPFHPKNPEFKIRFHLVEKIQFYICQRDGNKTQSFTLIKPEFRKKPIFKLSLKII